MPTELICYVHPAWAPRLRPAGHKRDWMEDTPERYAYRCLPLAIANAHGWEIGSPCGFEARWNGGTGKEAVEIRLDPGTDVRERPVSLFGHGTLTFHVEGLFRTSPGWNLWVGGPPNEAKDAIAPLGGIIETDWSPYTFTMNWRFTRANHWVRFEEDETFCFFFPVERGALDGVKPEIRSLSDAPGLEADYMAWSASRSAFHEHVKRTQPKRPTDQWQKLYYRGVGPNEEPGPADHQSKLRLAEFADLRGDAGAQGCPVHKVEAAAAAVAKLPGLGAPAVDRRNLSMALRNIGFDPKAPAKK